MRGIICPVLSWIIVAVVELKMAVQPFLQKISGGHEGSVEQFVWKNVNFGREVGDLKICGRVGMYDFAIR